MLWLNLSRLIILPSFYIFLGAIVALAPKSMANEGGGAAKEGSGEGAEKDKSAKMSPQQKENIEYQKKMSRLNTLKSRLEEADRTFEEVVKHKNHSHDKTEQQHLAEELIAIAKDRKEWSTEYNSLRQQILYTYPNKGEEIKKKFEPNEHRGPEEKESSTGLDDQLSQVRGTIDKKYAPFMPKEEIAAKALEEKPKSEKPKKLKLVK